MLLKELNKNGSYIHLERHVNIFKKIANEVSRKYWVDGREEFIVPEFLLPKDKVRVYKAFPNTVIEKKIIGKKAVRFFIHPEMIDQFKGTITVSLKNTAQPTASTRTLLPKNKNFFIKTHLDRRISHFIRRLSGTSVQHSILVSRELERISKEAPNSFAYLPESIGIVFQGKGMIVREKIPRPISREKRVLIPLFSIYAPDPRSPKERILMEQLIETSKKEPLKWLEEDLLMPLFRNFDWVLNNTGLLLEPHGQNTLLEVDMGFKVRRIVHRDFQSMYVDNKIRKKLGLPLVFKKHIMGKECKKEISYSLVYNRFMGRRVFDCLAQLVKEKYHIDKRKTISTIRKVFRKTFSRTLSNNIPRLYYYNYNPKKEMFKDNDASIIKIRRHPRYVP